MDVKSLTLVSPQARRRRRVFALPLLAGTLALGLFAHAPFATASTSSSSTGGSTGATGTTPSGQGEGTLTKANPSATLEECLTMGAQAERAATFEGEMAVIPGAARMEMRIDVLERLPHELSFHMVSAPGLGVWRKSAPGVKTYTYLKQVTNLGAPAIYRGAVEFRWMNDKGRPIKTAVLLTNKCKQPVSPPSETPPPATEAPSGTSTETTPSTGAGGTTTG